MIRLSLVVLLSLLVNLASCQSANSGKSGGAVSTVSVSEFQQKLAAAQTAQLIDVRTREEFSSGHLKNAVNIDIHADDFMDRIGKLDKTKPVMVYCRSGARSSSAASKMKDAGFKEVYNLDGGITSWSSEGKPVE